MHSSLCSVCFPPKTKPKPFFPSKASVAQNVQRSGRLRKQASSAVPPCGLHAPPSSLLQTNSLSLCFSSTLPKRDRTLDVASCVELLSSRDVFQRASGFSKPLLQTICMLVSFWFVWFLKHRFESIVSSGSFLVSCGNTNWFSRTMHNPFRGRAMIGQNHSVKQTKRKPKREWKQKPSNEPTKKCRFFFETSCAGVLLLLVVGFAATEQRTSVFFVALNPDVSRLSRHTICLKCSSCLVGCLADHRSDTLHHAMTR